MNISIEEEKVLGDFSFIEQAGIIFCKLCKHGIENLSSFRSHLRNSKHADAKNVKISAKAIRNELLSGTRWEKMRDNISSLPPCLGGSTFSEDQLRYHNAHVNTSARLLRIEGLPIKFGYVCKECNSFCCKTESELREHLIVMHSYSCLDADDAVKNVLKVPMQSLRQGIWEKLFPVRVPTAQELIDVNANVVARVKGSDSPKPLTNRLVSAHGNPAGTVAAKPNEGNNRGNSFDLSGEEIVSDLQALNHQNSAFDGIIETRKEVFPSEILKISDHDVFPFDPVEKSMEDIALDLNSYFDNGSILNEEPEAVTATGSYLIKPVKKHESPFKISAQTTTDLPNLVENTEQGQLQPRHSQDVPETFFQAALESVLRSVQAKETGPLDVGLHAETDYRDVPLHTLAADMKKSVNKMLKYNDFTGILVRSGFQYLGSVVTALCHLPDRMATSIQKLAAMYPPVIGKSPMCSRDDVGKPFDAKRWPLGKANSPLVHFLGHFNPEGPLRSLHNDDVSRFSISSIEKKIQCNVKSYLRVAGATTNAAPNFIRSAVMAHNGVFHIVGSRGSFANNQSRSGRKVDSGAAGSANTAGGVVPISKVEFFKVVTTDGSITKYGNEITRLILMIIRVFLVRRHLAQPGPKQIKESSLSELTDNEELSQTMGKLPLLLEQPSVVDAVVTCLCSVGYCLHEKCGSCSSYVFSNSARLGLDKCNANGMMSNSPCFCKKNEAGESKPKALQTSFLHSEGERDALSSENLADEHDDGVNSPRDTFQRCRNPMVKEALPHSVSEFSVADIGIHWLLRALLLSESSERSSTESMIIPKFMSFLSVADPGDDVKKRRFREAHELTGTTAALAYGMKCCGVVEMCREAKDWVQYVHSMNERCANELCPSDLLVEEQGWNKIEASDPFGTDSALNAFLSLPTNATNLDETLCSEKEDQRKANIASDPMPKVAEEWLMSHQQVSRCFSTSHNTVAAYLVGVHNSLRECVKGNEDVRLRFVECKRPEHGKGTCALVDGKECSLGTITKAVRTWHSRARNLISERLLLGMRPADGFESMTELLRDDFRNSERGKSFVSMTQNSAFVTDASSSVLSHIWNNKTLRHEFFGKSVFKRLRRINKKASKESKYSTAGSSSCTPANIESLDMREERLQKYLDDCQELQKLLLTCLHVTGGGTARATEQGYLLKNSAEARRNVFVSQGEMVFVARYNKTEGMKSQRNVIARFPDAETSRLFLKYIILIRPIEEFFIRYLHGDEAAEKHSESFFADIGEPFSDDKCRGEIVKLFAEAGIPFNFMQYRHYQIGIARLLMSKEILMMTKEDLISFHRMNQIFDHPVVGLIPDSPFLTSEADIGEKEEDHHGTDHEGVFRFKQVPDVLGVYPVHEQAGHTLQTADQIYGLSSSDMSDIGHTKLETFRRTSRAWHSILGLLEKVANNPKYTEFKTGCGRKRDYCQVAGTDSGKADRVKKAPRKGMSDFGMDVQFERNLPKRIGDQTDATWLESAPKATTPCKGAAVPSIPINAAKDSRKLAGSADQLQTAITEGEVLHSGFTHVRNVPVNDSLPTHLGSDRISELLRYLRQMKNDTNARFKSMEQLYAVHLMLQRQTDMFVILPTGHGKTDMLLLVAFIEQTRLQKRGIGATPSLSIIIVPLVALSKDILRRCATAGIRAGTWSHNRRNVDSLSVMIVSVEQVERREFATMISEQANKRRLARIEMEECQTTGNWIDFRPSYASLKGNLRPPGIPVQIVLVSATVPPHQTSDLAEKHGVTQFHEIRASTARHNLSYNVRPVETPRFRKVEEHICQESIKTLQNHLTHWMDCGNSQANRDHSPRIPESQETGTKGQIILYCPTIRLRKLLSDMLSEFEFSTADISVLSYDSSLSNSEKDAVLQEWSAFQSRAAGQIRTSIQAEPEEGSLARRRCPDVRTVENDADSGDSTDDSSSESSARSSFQIIVATCGFGMGIDSPYVRSVIHVGFSRSLVEYVQESGRAGRDGNPAKCSVLFSRKLVEREMSIITSRPSDELEMMRLDATTTPNIDLTKRKRRETELAAFVQWAQTSLSCRRSSLFSYMDRTAAEMCLFNSITPMPISRESLCDFCEMLEENSRLDGNHLSLRISSTDERATTKLPGSDPTRPSITNTPYRDKMSTQPISSHENHVPSGLIRKRPSTRAEREHISHSDAERVNMVDKGHNVSVYSRDKAALDRSQAEKHMNAFKNACVELGRLCLVCLMTSGIRKKLEDCKNPSCRDWRCFKCLQSSHSVKTCELIPFRPQNPSLRKFAPQEHERRNHCFACGLDTWMRIRMHTREQFSKVATCPYVNALRLAALAWDIKKWRALIIGHFELQCIEHLDQSKPGIQDVAFFKWLRELNAKNQDRLRLMEVVEFILRRYAVLW